MQFLSFKLGLIILAALALQIEAQITRFSGVQSPQGFRDKHGLQSRLQEFLVSSEKRCGKSCGVRPGSLPHSDFAQPEKFLDYSMTASRGITVNVTRKDRFLERNLLRKQRTRRWISKRKLKKQLQECEARLQETQNALEAPRLLFVQMAQHCTLEMAAGRYYLRTTDMDADTYVFTEMPLQQANAWPTSYFVDYLFDELFPVEKPNAAFTFNVYNNQSEKTFEGPLISVLISSHQFVLQEDNTTLVVYELAQSSEQEATSPLSRFFRGSDPLANASVTYDHCSLFIDPASGDNADSFYNAAESRDNTIDALKRAAQTVENGPDETTQSDALQTYTRVWSFEEKPLTPKDVYRGAGDSLKALATLIQECRGKGCNTNDIVQGVSNMLMPVAFAIGAAFPMADAALTVVASIGLLFSSLFFDPASSQAGAVSPSQIEAAVKKGLARYDATKDRDLINQYSVFLKIDVDNLVRRTGSLAYIRNQKKDDFQAQIDKQVEHWKTDEFTGAWNEYQSALISIQADYDRWFGTVVDENNIRGDVVNWINDNANKCRVANRPEGMPKGTNYDQYPPPVYDSTEVNNFQNCRDNVREGLDKWNRLMEFAEAYLHMAVVLMTFSSQATVIMQMTSFCDPGKFDQSTINSKCLYNDAIQNMLSKVFVVQSRALFLHRVLAEIDEQCFHERGWPFSQQCTPNFCNFKWSLSLSGQSNRYSDLKHNLDNIGFFKIAESNSQNVFETCLSFRKNSGKDGFAYGGFWAYNIYSKMVGSRDPSNPNPTFINAYETFKYNDCGHLSEFLDSGFVFGAVPNYALKPDLPKCAALIDDPSLWGPDYSSDSPLKRFTPNLSCKAKTSIQTLEILAKGDNSVNECWGNCYDTLGRWRNPNNTQPFLFTVDDKASCTCFVTW